MKFIQLGIKEKVSIEIADQERIKDIIGSVAKRLESDLESDVENQVLP